MEEAGAAIAKWFAGLSGAALEAAIRKAFAQFDSDGSGLLDRFSLHASALYPARVGLHDCVPRREPPPRGSDGMRACREEFGKAMYAMGLRLKEEELKLLFNEYDVDGSGTIDLAEFTHMVKRYLCRPCNEDGCPPCDMTDGSNQPGAIYRQRWQGGDGDWESSAIVLQKCVRLALARNQHQLWTRFLFQTAPLFISLSLSRTPTG